MGRCGLVELGPGLKSSQRQGQVTFSDRRPLQQLESLSYRDSNTFTTDAVNTNSSIIFTLFGVNNVLMRIAVVTGSRNTKDGRCALYNGLEANFGLKRETLGQKVNIRVKILPTFKVTS